MQKKTVLHIIYNLGRGGAETMLVAVLKQLKDYNNVVVTLFDDNHFGNEFVCDKYYCLNLKWVLQLPFAVGRFKKIVHENNVDIVHSHLFWPTILARAGTPKKVALITTIHAFIANSLEYERWYIRLIDKITFKFHKNIIVTVANGALIEYLDILKVKPYKIYALHTFVDIKVFNNSNAVYIKKENLLFKLVTVGALRKQKNHTFFLEAFKHLNNKIFQLDIYGEGELRKELEQEIKEHDLNINLKGEVANIENILNQYDLFVMSSSYEGFSLSVLEAMALKMPLLLSNINSFKEQCENTSLYFDLNNNNDFNNKLLMLSADKYLLHNLGEAALERVINNFTLEQHMQGLRKIYTEALA